MAKSVAVISRIDMAESSVPDSNVGYGAWISSVETDRVGVLTLLSVPTTFRNMTLRVTLNTAINSLFYYFNVNEIDGPLQVEVPAGMTGDFHSTGEVSAIAGDRIGTHPIQAGAGAVEFIMASVEMETAGQCMTIMGCHTASETNIDIDNAFSYQRLAGTRNNNSSEGQASIKMPISGVSMYNGVGGGANSRTSDTIFRSRINGVDGNAILTVPALTGTASVYDTVNTDTITAGDLFNFSVETGSGTGEVFNLERLAAGFISTSQFMLAVGSGTSGFSFSAGVLLYSAIAGELKVSVDESLSAMALPIAVRVSKLYVRLSSNGTASAGTIKIMLRKNGADTVLTTTLNWDDTVDYYEVDGVVDTLVTDTLGLEFSTAGIGGGAIRVSYAGVVAEEIGMAVLSNPQESSITQTTATVSCDTDTA